MSMVIPGSVDSNTSPGLCRCEKDEWKAIQKEGIRNYIMSPYEDRYVDVKFDGKVSGPVSVAVVEVFFFILLFVFNYSSSLVIGVFLVIIILLFQVLHSLNFVKILLLMPFKLGAEYFPLHHFPVLAHSLLENFELSIELHPSVSLHFVTTFNYLVWAVKKIAISEDGTVDVGIAQFVIWSMRIMATTQFSRASNRRDACMFFCFCGVGLHQSRQATRKRGQAEFPSRSPGSKGKLWDSPKIYRKPPWSNSPVLKVAFGACSWRRQRKRGT
ncbi:hypothetical protein Ddye_030219 [Dipteronia dyeriana]|uniref:Uncharacterized protein n=1 Tax=Dipteronia dyeriana TaxID=168575 RepID=A0AAD9TGM0_9ROSI|nr:hypothetical protein Ddye_030219 [Dipteronia dyeriana]